MADFVSSSKHQIGADKYIALEHVLLYYFFDLLIAIISLPAFVDGTAFVADEDGALDLFSYYLNTY